MEDPLFNHLILERILSYLKLKDLKSFCGVCSQWKQIGIPFLLNSSKIKVRDLMKFLHSGLTHQNFHLDSINLQVEDLILKKFAEANEIKDLVLSNCVGSLKANYFPLVEDLSLRSGTIEGAFQHLKRLEIYEDVDEIQWNMLWRTCPKLQVLNVQCKSRESLKEMLTTLHIANLPITDLISFLTEFENEHLEILVNIAKKKTLELLDISLSPKASKQSIVALINSLEENLLSLKIFREAPELCSFPYGSIMKNLRSLEIMGNMVETLDFLIFTPKLTSLHLNQTEEDFMGKSREIQIHCLTSLSIEHLVDPIVVTQIASIFPSLNKLSLFLNDNTIGVVFKMKNLEELIVFGTDLTDEGITGLPFDILSRGYKYMKDFRKSPFIGDAKKLRKFTLYPQPYENITDHSIHHGFLFAKELTSIELPETSITDDGIELLKMLPGLVNLSALYYLKNGEPELRKNNIKTMIQMNK